ncbi:hypothetical protein FOL47_006062 [Perkinsus chesapeaki]|uniref:Uncharacterized protein n=1 Tax=Perkinsus chesapeaki TaxID=330153 RepID=A0A7J6LTY5_PERCH|nr:hypothetical protein FOL47_006062 [Perkinsus chesapeaki]
MDANAAPTSPPGPTTSRLLAARHRIQRIINTSGKDEFSDSSSSSDEDIGLVTRVTRRTHAPRSTDKRAKEQVEAWMSTDDEENNASNYRTGRQTEREKELLASKDDDAKNNKERMDSHKRDRKHSKGTRSADCVTRCKEVDYVGSDEEVSMRVSDLLWIREVVETQRNALEAFKATNCILVGGIQKVLKHHGIKITKKDAMDASSPVSASRLVRALAKSLDHVK